ncbi:helix-turn-helix domain-containing protein [Pseudomaricurvus sp.]|uniref:helix-turn-helix domain-containing protein n=1 Tax=Pseudomaricurvus sp. TaxID=2004510 RepID=UPI003F6B0F5D
MSETLFSFDKNNYQSCQDTYRGDGNQEYYLGDYSIEAGSVIDVRADKKSVGPCSIIRLRSKTRLNFKRNWYHIRADATDVVVLWFVKRGSLSISHSGGRSVASSGDFAITKSMTPFSIECKIDDDAMHDVLHVLVPSHVFRELIPQDVSTGFTVSSGGRLYSIIENMLTEVLESTDELQPHAEKMLLNSALTLLSGSIIGHDNLIKERQTIAEQRLDTVLRYIEIHLSDPKLSTAMVAEACGISPRYLSVLLKQKDISFSEYIWDQRLKIASRWLSTSKPTEISIAEIAFRVGFKSPAHFSRKFKRVHGKGPREYRADSFSVLEENSEIYKPDTASINTDEQDFFMGSDKSTLQ